jgi:hypothetical protein
MMPGSQLHEPEARRATTIHPWRQAVPHHGREPRSDPQSKGREQIASLELVKDSPECLLIELLKNAGKTWTSRSL